MKSQNKKTNVTTLFTILFLLSLIPNKSMAQKSSSLAVNPPMGWNSWNWFGKEEVNEENMRQCMKAVVEEGLLDAGYEYFVIDGGWRDTKLSPDGKLVPHPAKFPNGIKPLADYAHSLGLKFGLHTVPGTHDCGGDTVGGYGREEIHIQQFVDWGVDFIKLDKCIHEEGWDEKKLKKVYKKWHRLIQNCKNEILFSISAHHPRNPWYPWFSEISQIARTTGDIRARVSGRAVFDSIPQRSVMMIADENNKWADFAGNGYWNDPDFLATGNQGLTIEEQKVHFALWCIMTAPLILGNNPLQMTPEEKSIITNKLAISINQDTTEQGKRIKKKDGKEVWVKNLYGGDIALLLINRNADKPEIIDVSLNELGISGACKVKNVYTGEILKDLVDRTVSQQLEPHTGLFLIIEKNKI